MQNANCSFKSDLDLRKLYGSIEYLILIKKTGIGITTDNWLYTTQFESHGETT